jgi:hypothetical protein
MDKDEALSRVLNNSGEWWDKIEQAWSWWIWYQASKTFQFDEFRYWAEAEGLVPHHPNAWGAAAKELTKNLSLAGYGQAIGPKARGRLTRIYYR